MAKLKGPPKGSGGAVSLFPTSPQSIGRPANLHTDPNPTTGRLCAPDGRASSGLYRPSQEPRTYPSRVLSTGNDPFQIHRAQVSHALKTHASPSLGGSGCAAGSRRTRRPETAASRALRPGTRTPMPAGAAAHIRWAKEQRHRGWAGRGPGATELRKGRRSAHLGGELGDWGARALKASIVEAPCRPASAPTPRRKGQR